MPFAHAARELGWLNRAPVGALLSEVTAGRLTETAGAAYVAEQTAAVEALKRRPMPEPLGPVTLQVSADGATISLVRQQWAEINKAASPLVAQPRLQKTEPHPLYADEVRAESPVNQSVSEMQERITLAA